MDEIVYIIIGVAWVVFGIYKNYQKQLKNQNKNLKTEKPETPKTSVKDLFEQLFPIEEFTNVDDRSQEEIFVENQSLESININEQYSNYKEKVIIKEEKIVEKKKTIVVEEENHFLADFDPRKALIYSLILERPYK